MKGKGKESEGEGEEDREGKMRFGDLLAQEAPGKRKKIGHPLYPASAASEWPAQTTLLPNSTNRISDPHFRLAFPR